MARTFDRRTLGAELGRARSLGWEAHMRGAERATSLPKAILRAIASQAQNRKPKRR